MSVDRFTSAARRRPSDDEAAVRSWLGAAGHRPPPPESHLAAIRAAAGEEWERRLGHERARRRLRRDRSLAIAAGLALAIAAAWWWRHAAPTSGRAPALATIELAVGALRVDSPGGGAAIVAGTRLESAGGAALHLADGAALRLAADTVVTLRGAGRLVLARGGLYLDSAGAAPGREVSTALGTVRELGTRFAVRLADSGSRLVVAVRDGAVAVGERRVGAGERLIVAAGEPPELGPIAAWDPAWSWARDLARAPLADGSSLLALLEWSCHESGRRLVFAPPELAERAATIEVHGPLADLPPDSAAAAALAGAGFAHHFADGELQVSDPPAPADRAPE